MNESNPGYDEIYFNLAIAYQGTDNLEEAEKNFIRACEINPVSFEYFLSGCPLYRFLPITPLPQ